MSESKTGSADDIERRFPRLKEDCLDIISRQVERSPGRRPTIFFFVGFSEEDYRNIINKMAESLGAKSPESHPVPEGYLGSKGLGYFSDVLEKLKSVIDAENPSTLVVDMGDVVDNFNEPQLNTDRAIHDFAQAAFEQDGSQSSSPFGEFASIEGHPNVVFTALVSPHNSGYEDAMRSVISAQFKQGRFFRDDLSEPDEE